MGQSQIGAWLAVALCVTITCCATFSPRARDKFTINAVRPRPYKPGQYGVASEDADTQELDARGVNEVDTQPRDGAVRNSTYTKFYEILRNSTSNNPDAAVPELLNLRPVIGILAQEVSHSMEAALRNHSMKNHSSYIAASYVKSMEGAGARVVPVMINRDQKYYEKLGRSLNGILFPGGSASVTNSSGYGAAGDLLYQIVLASNARGQPMPLWATCLGFEMLVYLAAGRTPPLTSCSASNRADPLVFLQGWQDSQVWRGAPASLKAAVETENITSNFHKQCVTPESFDKLGVSKSFYASSVNTDDDGLQYVSTIEHKVYPIFGTQWHPEKNSYEWRVDFNIPHSANAVDLERYMSKVFVQQARRNNNTFASEKELEANLIYNYNPVYMAHLYKSSFQQVYLFD